MDSTIVLAAVIMVVLFAMVGWGHLSAPLPAIPYNERNKWYPFGDIFHLVMAGTPVDYFSQHVQKYGNVCQVLLGPLGRLVLVSDVRWVEIIVCIPYGS